MTCKHLCVVTALIAGSLPCARAQGPFFQSWQQRASRAQSVQPAWSVPLVAPYPMLIQVFRFDTQRQITPTHTDTWNYGASRGLNLIPGFRSEFDIDYAPYIQHHSAAHDGFGDVAFLYKYRLLSSKARGGHLLSAQVGATVPTGSYTNGSKHATFSPAVLAGKGFGRFDVIASLGGTLPEAQGDKLGRTVAFNATAQYHVGKLFWPELETNLTRFYGGSNDGKLQNFLTPGVTFGKVRFHPGDAASRTGLALGTGMQIATTHFHTYDHNLVFTGRFLF